MGVLVEDMISDVRVDSGLRDNPLFSNEKIIGWLNEGRAKLRDIFIAAGPFNQWFRDSEDFTLEGGVDGSTFDLSALPLFQEIQYINRNPISTTPEPVTELGSIQERSFGNGVPAGWNGGRKYDAAGDVLTIYPFNNSSGDYRLYYSSMGKTFALPITVDFDIDVSTVPIVPSPLGPGPGAWSVPNITFTDQIPIDESATLTFDFDSPNTLYSGTYFINYIVSQNVVSVSNLASTAGYSNPAAGSGSLVYQSVNTRNDLEQVLAPWQSFIKLFASIKVRQARRQPTGDLLNLFEIEEKRAIKMSTKRTQGVKQAPMTHNRMRRRGYSYGSAQ